MLKVKALNTSGEVRNAINKDADVFRVLANPLRLMILKILHDHKGLSVTDLFTLLDAEQSHISHALKYMRENGVVSYRREGRIIYYFITNDYAVELMKMSSVMKFQTKLEFI